MAKDDAKTKAAHRIEETYKPESMALWLEKNRPATYVKMRNIYAQNLDQGGGLRTSGMGVGVGDPYGRAQKTPSAADLREADKELKKLDSQQITLWVQGVGGDATRVKAKADYNTYVSDRSKEMAEAVHTATKNGVVDPEYDFAVNAPNPTAFNRRSSQLAEDEDPEEQEAKGTEDKGAVSANGTPIFDAVGAQNGEAPGRGFAYDGISELLDLDFDLESHLTADQMRSPDFQVAVTGGGMTDQVAKARTTTQAIDRDVAMKMGHPSSGRPRPTMGQRGLEQIAGKAGGIGVGGLTPSGPIGMTGKSRSYAESMAYFKTLQPAQIQRIQQHLAMAGYFSPSELKGREIMWGYAGDQKTAYAWNLLHAEALNQKKDISQIIKDRQIQNAPAMAAFLADPTGAGAAAAEGGQTYELTLSDPDTIKMAADNAFVQILGRLPDDKERQILVGSVQTAERQQGQSKLAQINSINKKNQARANAQAQAAAGITGTPWSAEMLGEMQGELDVLLGAGPKADGGIIFPVAGKASYSNDWGQGRSGGRSHQGTDIFAAEGTGVVAAVAGTVRSIGTGGVQGKMKSISITGADGKNYFYNHLGDNVAVKPGQRVSAGQIIAAVGNAVQRIGTGNHLHFSINEGHRDRAENPFPYLQRSQKTGSTALPIGPQNEAQIAATAGAPEAIPAELLETENVDPTASVDQWAKEHRPDEYGAQKLGNAYETLTDMLRGTG
jgi:murein DD-endopeptidase MepM/ murein hydrolase activator NlpD